MNRKWSAKTSEVPLKYQMIEKYPTFSSPLVEKLTEHIKREGRDRELELELFDELCRTSETDLWAIAKEISKHPFLKTCDPWEPIPSSRAKMKVSHIYIYSTKAELYTRLVLTLKVTVKRNVGQQTNHAQDRKTVTFVHHPRPAYSNGAAMFNNCSRTQQFHLNRSEEIRLTFVFYRPGATFKCIQLLSFGTQIRYFIPILIDITVQPTEDDLGSKIAPIPSSVASSSSSSISKATKINDSTSSKGYRPELKELKKRKEAIIDPKNVEHRRRPPNMLTLSLGRVDIGHGVGHLKLRNRWECCYISTHRVLVHSWAKDGHKAPSPEDWYETMKWQDQYEHQSLASRVAAGIEFDSVFIVYDAPSLNLTQFFYRFVHNSRFFASPDQIYRVLLSMASGMEYLHSCGKSHGALQPNAIAIDDSYSLKIIDYDDFGSKPPTTPGFKSTWFSNPNKDFFDDFAAPELFKSSQFTLHMDTFSFGLIIWHIFTFSDPRSNPQDILDGKIPDLLAPTPAMDYLRFLKLHTLVESCTSTDPILRPSMTEVFHIISSLFTEWNGYDRKVKEKLHPSFYDT
jgi:hypothetical protein